VEGLACLSVSRASLSPHGPAGVTAARGAAPSRCTETANDNQPEVRAGIAVAEATLRLLPLYDYTR
jgi:hypothetical protein